MNFTVTIKSAGILAVMTFSEGSGQDAVGKWFPVGHQGEAFEDACTEIARQIEKLKSWGVDEFRFTKDDEVSIPQLYAISTRIAEQVEGARTATMAKAN